MPMTPKRRLTLAIVIPVALVIVAWSAFSLVASLGSSQFSFSAPLANPGGKLTAHFENSDVTIVPGDAARVSGTTYYSLVRPHVAIGDGAVTYRCPVPTGTCGMSATLTVPAAAGSMNVSTGGGAIELAGGVAASATFATDSGDITADGLAGTASLDSGGGAVSAAGITAARVTVNSDSGNVTLRFAKAPVAVLVNSGGGGVSIVLPRGDYIFQVNAAGGQVSMPASTPGAHDLITVNSDSGDVTVSED